MSGQDLALLGLALAVGLACGWLWRGVLCRRAHAHLVPAYDDASLGALLDGDDPRRPDGADDAASGVDRDFAEPAARPVSAEPVTVGPTAPERPLPPGPYPGSVLPSGTAPPEGFVVKATTASGIYHAPGSPSYARTRGDVFFTSVADAEAAGFRAPRTRTSTAAGNRP